jgi:hypothetical protein
VKKLAAVGEIDRRAADDVVAFAEGGAEGRFDGVDADRTPVDERLKGHYGAAERLAAVVRMSSWAACAVEKT